MKFSHFWLVLGKLELGKLWSRLSNQCLPLSDAMFSGIATKGQALSKYCEIQASLQNNLEISTRFEIGVAINIDKIWV